MIEKPVEVVTNKEEIYALAGADLYKSQLQDNLTFFKKDYPNRAGWTIGDLDIYIQKHVSSSIVSNEYRVSETKGKRSRKKTDKEMIVALSEQLGLEIMAVKHIYTTIKQRIDFGSTKEEVKDYVTIQIYDVIEELDLKIASSMTEEDTQKWYKLKMEAMDRLVKLENIEKKSDSNTLVVQGNLNNQTNSTTTVDKQIVVSEGQAMMNLLKKIMPSKD